MKKIILFIALIFVSIVILLSCFMLANTTFIESQNKDYFIADVCIDIGGAGYLGNFYYIDKSIVIPKIYNTNCSTPGCVEWITDSEFEIVNRSGKHHFSVTNNGLKTE